LNDRKPALRSSCLAACDADDAKYFSEIIPGNLGAHSVEGPFRVFERRLRRRNPIMGEVSEGAIEAPSD
jgi:hypothetical protein